MTVRRRLHFGDPYSPVSSKCNNDTGQEKSNQELTILGLSKTKYTSFGCQNKNKHDLKPISPLNQPRTLIAV